MSTGNSSRRITAYLVAALWLSLSLASAWWLRDGPVRAPVPSAAPTPSSAFPWAIVGELALVMVAYSAAIRRGEWRNVHLALAFWCAELLWEMVNALIGHFFGAPLFGVRGQTAWHIYMGLNAEITLMFALVPLVLFDLLPRDEHARIAGLSARWLVPTLLGLLCVAVEVMLNRAGALTWAWWFWRWPHLGLIVFAYCAPFVLLAKVRDRLVDPASCRRLFVAIGATALACHLVFHTWLGWVG